MCAGPSSGQSSQLASRSSLRFGMSSCARGGRAGLVSTSLIGVVAATEAAHTNVLGWFTAFGLVTWVGLPLGSALGLAIGAWPEGAGGRVPELRVANRRRVAKILLGACMLAAAVVGAGLLGIAYPDLWVHRNHALLGASLVGLFLLSWRLLPQTPRQAWVDLALAVLAVAGAQWASARCNVFELTTRSFAVNVAWRATAWLSDLDGDGASHLFGGLDCMPLNQDVGPLAREVPGNGIDDNCLGGDLQVLAAARGLDPGYTMPPPGVPKRPNLVLITVDSLRADILGVYGAPDRVTPRLDHHAKNAVVFESAFAQGPGTYESLPSLLTSRYPYDIDYVDSDELPYPLATTHRLLAEVLSDNGYQTAAVFACHLERQTSWGLCRGFGSCDTSLIPERDPYSITSDRVTERGLALLETFGRAPFFLWLHYFDPHSHYMKHARHETGSRTTDRERYAGEVEFTDQHLGRLFDVVLGERFRENTIVVLSADHGEGFLEDHGHVRHGYGLSAELVHVPMLWWVPGALGRRRSAPVENLDIMPTLLNYAGIEASGLQGRSLVANLHRAEEDQERAVFSEKTFPSPGVRMLKAITTRDYRLIYDHGTGQYELFDRRRDPAERLDRSREEPDQARHLMRMLEGWMEDSTSTDYRHVVDGMTVSEVPNTARRLSVRLADGVELSGIETPSPIPAAGYPGAWRPVLYLSFNKSVGQQGTSPADPARLRVALGGTRPPESMASSVPGYGRVPLEQQIPGKFLRHVAQVPVPKESGDAPFKLWVGWGAEEPVAID